MRSIRLVVVVNTKPFLLLSLNPMQIVFVKVEWKDMIFVVLLNSLLNWREMGSFLHLPSLRFSESYVFRASTQCQAE